MAHAEPIKTNGRAYNVSPAVFLGMPGFRQMHITFTIQTIWMAKCRIVKSKCVVYMEFNLCNIKKSKLLVK